MTKKTEQLNLNSRLIELRLIVSWLMGGSILGAEVGVDQHGSSHLIK